MLKESDLRVLVYKKGFRSYAQLARKAGIYPQTLNSLLRGTRKTLKHREIIAKLLSVPFDFLWD